MQSGYDLQFSLHLLQFLLSLSKFHGNFNLQDIILPLLVSSSLNLSLLVENHGLLIYDPFALGDKFLISKIACLLQEGDSI